MNMTVIIFYILAFITVMSALMVVKAKNIVHCALFLVLSFIGIAGLYILLEAEFVAAVQVLIYGGAITVLILFAVMLTARIWDKSKRQTNEQQGASLIITGALLVLIIMAALGSGWNKNPVSIPENTTAVLGKLFLTTYVLPFEIASVFLLVALIGAIVLAKKEKD